MRADKAYDELVRRVREEGLLTTVEALLEWDEETYMPSGGVGNRSEQLALLAGLLHERGTDPRIGVLLGELEDRSLLDDPLAPAAVNVRVLRHEYDRSVRVPKRLVEDVARTTALAQKAWAAARAASRFATFRAWLEKIIELKRAEAECVGYESEPYDALIEDYEPGLSSAVMARLFDALRRSWCPWPSGSPQRVGSPRAASSGGTFRAIASALSGPAWPPPSGSTSIAAGSTWRSTV